MDQSITKYSYKDKEITIIGTAHVSGISAKQVKDVIKELHPDSICIELDQGRYDSINNPKKWNDTDLIKVIKEHKTGYMLVNLLLSSYQKRVAKKLESKSGAEMMQAISLSKEDDIPLIMADRDIQLTFSRIYRKHSFFQKVKLVVSMIMSLFDDEDITEADIENLKQSEVLEAALAEIAKQFPIISEVLVDERNRVLAHHIQNAPGNNIVAVVGAAHVPGILEYLDKDDDISELLTLPEKKLSSKLAGWIIPITIIGMILYMFTQNQGVGLQQIKHWILWNGSSSALGTLFAGGHPLSILTAFIASPITSLNPLLAAGWFAGIVECLVRKPKVKDFDTLSEDCATLKGILHNKVTKVLLVVILANVFSTLGTIIGGLDIFSNLMKFIR